MFLEELFKRAPGLFIVWILAILLFVVLVILYLMYHSADQKGREEPARNLGNAVGGIGIGIAIAAGAWVLLLINLVSSAANIQRDASSIYVSRDNLLLNWVTTEDSGGHPIGNPISGNNPTDGTICFKGFQSSNDPLAYEGYKAFVKSYAGPVPIPTSQYYTLADGTTYKAADDIDNQRKLSLAYYRYLYCTKQYYQEILNGTAPEINAMSFLSSTAKANLIHKTSSCDHGKIPDTQACLDGKTTQSCAQNECWIALNETISAQCLLYDDHVYNRINAGVNPKGALASMEIGPPRGGGPAGIQVLGPHLP